MSKHTVQSLSTHLLSGWSTVEKGNIKICPLSLASDILSHANSDSFSSGTTSRNPKHNVSNEITVSSLVVARLISMITAQSDSDSNQVFRIIQPFIEQQLLTSPASWPIAVTTTCFPSNELHTKIPAFSDPFETLMRRLSTLNISPTVLKEDLTFATPLELLAVGLCTTEKDPSEIEGNTITNGDYDDDDDDDDDDGDKVKLVPISREMHYTPNSSMPDKFDYLVNLGLKDPPKPKPVPKRPSSSAVNRTQAVRAINSSRRFPPPSQTAALVTLGRNGPNARPPDLCRLQLNDSFRSQKSHNSNNINSSYALNQSRNNSNNLQSPRSTPFTPGEVVDLVDSDSEPSSPVPASNVTSTPLSVYGGAGNSRTNVANPSVLSPNQPSTDNEVQHIDQSDAGQSSRSIHDVDDVAPEIMNLDNSNNLVKQEPVQPFNEKLYRRKLYAKRREAMNSQVAMSESDMPTLPSDLPDTVHSINQVKKLRQARREKSRKLKLEKEKNHQKVKKERKKRRLEQSKNNPRLASGAPSANNNEEVSDDNYEDDDDDDDEEDDDDDDFADEIMARSRQQSRRPRHKPHSNSKPVYVDSPEKRQRNDNGFIRRPSADGGVRTGRDFSRSGPSGSSPHMTRSLNGKNNVHHGMSPVEMFEQKRRDLYAEINGRMNSLSYEDQELIDDFLKGRDHMFQSRRYGPSNTFDVLVHRDPIDGQQHYLRLRKNSRTWECIQSPP